MDSETFRKKLLNTKKQRVIEIAYLVCEKERLPIPKINFKGCQQETENQLAHYHPDENKICISETQLHKLKTLKDVENTTYHELAHILEQNHGGGFVKTRNKFQLDTWRPPRGVIYISAEVQRQIRELESRQKSEKISVDKTLCNYHLCRKKRKLSQCPHCKRYFCSEHIRPVAPGKLREDDSDYKSMSYHPCGTYVDFARKKEENEHTAYRNALDAMKYEHYDFNKKEPIKSNIKPESKIDYSDNKTKPKVEYKPIKQMSKAEIEESRKKLGIDTDHVPKSKPKKKNIFDKIKTIFGIDD